MIQSEVGFRCWFFFRLVCGLWLLAAARVSAGNFYAGTSPTNVPWAGGVVPYEFTNSLTTTQQVTYLDGLREWELAANVQFVPHTTQTNWILFCYNTNFIDYVAGGSYSPQVITVSSLSRAQVCHEMGHSFGFTHENIRPDATNYIAVLTNNIANEPTNIYWFTVDPASVTNGNYDFESVMHLGWDFDSTNVGVLATQQPRPPYFPRYQFRMGNFCISPGDRAALAYLYGPPAVPLTNIVTTTANVGPGSLRAAIYYATDHPGSVVKFNISTNDPGYSNGVFNIHLTGQLPPLVANGMVMDGSTQPGFAGQPLIVVDGSQILPETFTSDTGVLIYSSSNQLKNIAFTGFNWNGLTLEYAGATNNTIAGCWLGVDATGSNAAPNAFQGILIASGASGNTIGGTNALARNVLSGNSQYGIFITDSNTTGNVVLGNFIGTDASGSNAVPNESSGVFVGNAAGGNTIGVRNVLSGNSQYGVFLTNTTGNVISGNYIGVNAGGQTALANGLGGVLLTTGATNNTIGGTVAVARNVVSGNTTAGIFLAGTTSGNLIEGNYVGTDISGTNAVPNTLAGIYAPYPGGPSGNVIGGTAVGARNVISGNSSYDVYFAGLGTGGNLVEGNYLGVTPDGTRAVGSTFAGVIIFDGATNNTIGGATVGAGNVISGSYGYGVYISDPGTAGNVVQGNIIGADYTGTNALGNGYHNVLLQLGAANNIIGGTGAGVGNVIAFSPGAGVLLLNSNTTNNAIRGNSIFSNGNLGINFNNTGVVTNHTGFLAGPNDLQNFPIVTNAVAGGMSTTVSGTLNSAPNSSFSVDIYRNPTPDLSGYGEGQFYVGSVNVNTDGSGNGAFTLTLNGNYAGQYFAVTATAANGDTSEFSADLLAVSGPAAQFVGPFQSGAGGFSFNLTLQTNFSYRIQTTTNLATPIVWTDLTNFTATDSPFPFTDHSANNYRVRFYRVVSP